MTLLAPHRQECYDSGLTDQTIKLAGLYSAPAARVRELLGYRAGPGYVIPYPEFNGGGPYVRVKLDQADAKGKRYRSPLHEPNRLYVPALIDRAQLTDPTVPLFLTEGERKALKGAQEGLLCLAIAGVWSWRTKTPTGESLVIDDFDAIVWRGRCVYLVFDSDAAHKGHVREAEVSLAEELRRRGAVVQIIRLPPGPDGQKVGLDNYLVTHSIETFCALEPVAVTAAPWAAADWPPLAPVPTALPPVPPCDIDALLPDAFAGWVRDVAERAQCPPDYVAIGLIVAAGAVIGRQLTIRPKVRDDWTVVPNVWGLGIGPPGVMKTYALESGQIGLRALAALARVQHRQALVDWEFAVARAKAQRAAVEKQMKAAAERGEDLDGFRAALTAATPPKPPTERRYLANDATVESLGVLMNHNPNGVLLFRDEVSGLLRMQEREGHENDRAFYCEAWNGTGSYVYDRIGRGTLHIEAACLSVLGGIQPVPLGAYLRQTFGDGQDDGLIQRFQLMVYPDVPPTFQNVDRWPDSTTRRRLRAVFERLAALEPTALGAAADPDADARPYLQFTDDAQEDGDAWRVTLETRLRTEDAPAVFLAHLAKYRSLIPSLALILHLVHCVDTGTGGPISRAALGRALAWAAYLEPHAVRVYDGILTPGRQAAPALARRLTAGDLVGPFTVRDVRLKGWTGLTTPPEILDALDRLESLGWVRREPVRHPAGGRPTVRFHVNPAVHGRTGRP